MGVTGPPAFALVAPYLPAPPNTGGRIRIHHLALALTRLGPVDLYARYWPVEFAPEAGSSTAALEVYRRRVLWGSGCALRLVPGWHPKRAREAAPFGLRRSLFEAHAAAPYRAVVVCHSYAMGVVQGLRGTALVLDEHNIESHYAAALRPAERAEAARLARWERACWREVHAVTCVSDDDATEITRWRRDATVIPNGVAARALTFVPPSARVSREILFVGAMSHPPNVAAAVELVREVLPRVKRAFPEARVVLCGRTPSPEVAALAAPDVTVTGTVSSPAHFLARAGVYVNLLRAGAGSSLKVPEAMAAGVPLVSTALGVRGFPVYDGIHARLVERADAVADAVCDVWRDVPAADTRARAARLLAESLDWDTMGARFGDVVSRVVRA